MNETPVYGYDHMYVMRTRGESSLLEACKRVSDLCGIDFLKLYERALTIFRYVNSKGIENPGYMYVAFTAAFMMSGYKGITSYYNDMMYIYRVRFRRSVEGYGDVEELRPHELRRIMKEQNLNRCDIEVLLRIKHPDAIKINIRKLRRFVAAVGVQPEQDIKSIISEFSNISSEVRSLAMKLSDLARLNGVTVECARPRVIAAACVCAAYTLLTNKKPMMRHNVRKIYRKILRLYRDTPCEPLNTKPM